MGHPGDLKHPEVAVAIDRVLEMCAKYNKIPGIVTSSPEAAAERVAQGFRIVTIMNDLGIFRSVTLDRINRTHELVSKLSL